MTNHKYLFVEMTELARTVYFKNTSKVEVKGIRNVKFLQKNEELGMVEKIYYIWKKKINIISVSNLMKKGSRSSSRT
jgi:hypothetical protein